MSNPNVKPTVTREQGERTDSNYNKLILGHLPNYIPTPPNTGFRQFGQSLEELLKIPLSSEK